MSEPKVVTVSTDGSCLSPSGEGHGPMGWGWVQHAAGYVKGVTFGGENPKTTPRASGGAADGTNNIGELTAILEALRYYAPVSGVSPARHLVIESDSNYAIQSVSEWIKGWKKNGWKNSNRKDVANKDLIVAIDDELEKRKKYGGTAKFVWVKGHNGDLYNEIVDDLARSAAERFRSGVPQYRSKCNT